MELGLTAQVGTLKYKGDLFIARDAQECQLTVLRLLGFSATRLLFQLDDIEPAAKVSAHMLVGYLLYFFECFKIYLSSVVLLETETVQTAYLVDIALGALLVVQDRRQRVLLCLFEFGKLVASLNQQTEFLSHYSDVVRFWFVVGV